MRKRTALFGFTSFFAFGLGTMFEFFHWPYSGIIMFTAFLILNFALLPSAFLDLYKRAI